ncbi:MAG: sulfate adenylyltransferase subunit CysN [Myxococcota bacterium]
MAETHASLSDTELIEQDIEAYLRRYQNKELLRFVAVGSVDDGKSTLIGRLLHDTGMVYEDQVQAVRKATSMEGEEIDFSLFTDGLRAEREQGITIDVAYRYFTTEKRKFIIADTPGHVQYTRNMVTGASTANVALILVDARLGVLQQSRRHAYIASLLGIPHLAVCINKMDLVGYDEDVYQRIREDFVGFAKDLRFREVRFFPVSSLKGANIVGPSKYTPWYDGGAVLEYLETVPVAADRNLKDFRFPVQYVLRPHLNYRGFAGQISSGQVQKGDDVVVLPSGVRSKVLAIDVPEGELEEAACPKPVVLRLEDEVDISRGDMLVKPDNLPQVHREFSAHLVWMSERPLDLEKTYVLKHAAQYVRAQVDQLSWKRDMDTLETIDAETLELNDIGLVKMQCHRALYFDAYPDNRSTGAFILVDTLTNNTVAAGMIDRGTGEKQDLDRVLQELRAGSGLTFKTQVSPRERQERMGQQGTTVWLVGLPGSGRWALAYALERYLFDRGRTATVVDPTDEDLHSMTSAAKACTDAGLVTICAFPSYRREDRQSVRERIGGERCIEVHVNTSEELCRERRPDADFSGFEAPVRPDVTVALDSVTLDEAIQVIMNRLDAPA